jgi:hypothetical protein
VGPTMRAIMQSFGRRDMKGDVVEELAFHLAETRQAVHRLCLELAEGRALERPELEKALFSLEWQLQHLSGHVKSGLACLKKVRAGQRKSGRGAAAKNPAVQRPPAVETRKRVNGEARGKRSR